MAEVKIVKNVFWIGANILFDLQSGATNQVLMFVHREEEASVFDYANAQAFQAFIKTRAERLSPGIVWSVEKSKSVLDRWVIKGEQDVS